MLTAITACIGLHGLEGSTLERMAQESGFSRSHIRHYLGNRDQVIDAVWDHLMTPYLELIDRSLAVSDPEEQMAGLMDFLFGPLMRRSPDDPAIEALINGAVKDAHLREKVYVTYRGLEQQLSRVLRALAPAASRSASDGLAFSLITMSIGSSFLSGMPFPPARRRSVRSSADRLVQDLLDKSQRT